MALNLRATLYAEGFTHISGAFSASDLEEVDVVTDTLIASWDTSAQDEDFWWFRQENSNILYRIHNLERKHPSIRALLRHDSLARLVGMAIGESFVATACALIYKMPLVGAEVPWHRDPVDVPACTTYNFSIYLDSSTAENGAIEFVPGSHLNQHLYSEGRPPDAVLVTAEPGDVCIHDVRTYHGSSFSNCPQRRRSIITEFRPVRFNPTALDLED